nr:hypothetical protein [Tanacetum cinerariifolium]
MVAYLTKSDASEGFTQIIDFLNGNYIKYALTANPNIYVSCIKQFWTTVAIKQVNDVTKLQALVDKKKVVVTEAAIREVENSTFLTLTRRVKHLEYDKVAQALEITKLERRVKKLEKRNKGRMIAEIDKDDVVVLMDDKEEDKKVEEAKVVESAQEDETEPAEVQEVVDVVTTAKLITEVVTAASETVTAASAIIPTIEPQIHAATLTVAPARVAAAPSRRRKRVVIMDPEEESTTSTSTIIPETKSKDKGKGILDVAIDHVKLKAKEDPVVKRYQAMKRKPQTEAQAQKNMMMYLKNVMEEEESRALQIINETPAEKAAKRRKLNEEVEDLKRHLEIMPDKDDDIYTEATPLTRKNFDRVDLEALWNLVKERFSTSKPKKFSDDFLLTTLGAMFDKPDLILLVERRYPLSRFTLDQMLNAVRLRVEEESEVSLELLRFTRQQHQEGQHE